MGQVVLFWDITFTQNCSFSPHPLAPSPGGAKGRSNSGLLSYSTWDDVNKNQYTKQFTTYTPQPPHRPIKLC